MSFDFDRPLLEDAIGRTISVFHATPWDFAHEEELHAPFFASARQSMGYALSCDGVQLSLLRHEYDSIYRYFGKTGFRERYCARPYSRTENPTTANFDFALLKRNFVESNDHLSVVNKDEERRSRIRPVAGAVTPIDSVAIDAAVEFAHVHATKSTSRPPCYDLAEKMQRDARKIALDGIDCAYLVAFSHFPMLDIQVADIYEKCKIQFQNFKPHGKIQAVFATRGETFLFGEWQPTTR